MIASFLVLLTFVAVREVSGCRRSEGGAPVSSLSEALQRNRGSEDTALRPHQSDDGRGVGGAAAEFSLQSIAESSRWEGESEADSSLSVRIG